MCMYNYSHMFDWAVYMFDGLVYALSLLGTCYISYIVIGLICELMKCKHANKFVKKCVMTKREILSWIPNVIYKYCFSDKYFYSKFTKRTIKSRRRQSRRYYIRYNRGKHSRIASKYNYARPKRRIDFVAYPSVHQANRIYDFDTSSFIIGVDSHATRCISNDISHFSGTIKPIRQGHCSGFGGTKTPIVGKGSVKWKFSDDKGIIHTFLIDNCLYVPKATICLMSPQHVDKCLKDSTGGSSRLSESTDSDSCIIKLKKGTKTYIKTLMHSARTNTPTFKSAPDDNKYHHFCMECEEDLGTKDLEITVSSSEIVEGNNDSLVVANKGDLENFREIMSSANDTIVASTNEGELLRWHYRLGHLSWKKLNLLALLGIIPRKLFNLRAPKCPCCIAAQMTRIPTRTKGPSSVRNIQPATKLGQYVSVDQMECSTPGFVAQLKGKLTRKRYRVATVYVDHYSDLTFTFNQESTSSNETLASKHAFEAFAREKGIPRIEHYHSDNGRFIDTAFVNDCLKQGQTQTCCGVNAHH